MSIKNLGRVILLSVAFGVITLGAVTWFFAYSHEGIIEVDLSPATLTAERPGRPALRFAVAPVLSPERTIDEYHAFADYLAFRLARPVRLVQRKTYHEVNQLLRHGSVQVAIICTGAYLHSKTEEIPLDVIAVPEYSDGPVYHSLLIVRAKDSFDTIQDLKGRSFAYSDPLSLSGHYYPLYLLLESGEEPSTYFGRTTFAYSHDGSLRAVLDGIADGAAVDSLVYDFEVRRNPSLGKELRIIHRSPNLGINPVVTPGSLDPALREAFRQAFVEMHSVPEGRKVLDSLKIKRFLAPPDGLYRETAKIYARVRSHLEKE